MSFFTIFSPTGGTADTGSTGYRGVATSIPQNELPARLQEVNKNKLIVTACRHNDQANLDLPNSYAAIRRGFNRGDDPVKPEDGLALYFSNLSRRTYEIHRPIHSVVSSITRHEPTVKPVGV
jgi:hypothetical protein